MMKKIGKYEKKPESAAKKQPEVKNILLQTYFTSLLSLVLCVSMFFGTSYAWFTSEITNTGNQIYIGVLDVALLKQVPDGNDEGTDPDYVSLAAAGENGTNTIQLFDGNIVWAPGYTTLETIQVENTGDLAFKYVLNFTDGELVAQTSSQAEDQTNANAQETLAIEDVAENFVIWVYKHEKNAEGNLVPPAPTSYSDISREGSGWVKAGTLKEVLAGIPVLEGAMNAPVKATVTEDGETKETVKRDSATYTIALHMNQEAGNLNAEQLMGQKLTLNVKLVAYQMTPEQVEYTGVNVTTVDTADSLKEEIAKASNNVLLKESVSLGNGVTMNGGVFNGNGKTLTYTGGRDTNNNSVGVLTTTGGVIKNLTIDGKENGRALYITELKSDLTVTNCVLDGAYSFNMNSSAEPKYSMSFHGTTFKSWTSYANAMTHASFANCRFENVLKPYGDTTLTNCTFVKAGANVGLDVSELRAGETITLVNCNYMGISGLDVTVRNSNESLTLDGNDKDLFEISGGMLILKQPTTTQGG